ncbi:hypothetical protein LINPERPRIM_LOCUS30809 [Linum perenne]
MRKQKLSRLSPIAICPRRMEGLKQTKRRKEAWELERKKVDKKGREYVAISKKGQIAKCTICKQPGHNRRKHKDEDFAVAADGGGCSVVAADARGTKMRAPSSPIAKSPTSTPDASSFMPNPSSHRSTQVDSPSKNTRSKKKAKNV